MSKRYPGGIIRKTPQTPSQTSAQGIWDMASVTQAVKENTWPIAGVPDPISKSLRFRSSASASLSRTPASASNRTTWTWSGWVKRAEITTTERTFFSAGTDGNNFTALAWINDSLYFQNYTSGTQTITNTTAVFRDPSAWYHIVLAIDTTQGTAADRAKIYVNGVQQAGFSGSPFSSSQQFWINFTYTHRIGSRQLSSADSFSEQYMTEVYLIDGQALTPSSFGNTNDQTGVWQPIAYTGTYGTNGFYLPFSNTASTSTLGNDFSGNSNNWTTNNISLTSGTTYDSMNDVPTQWIPYNTAGDTGALFRGNYCVLNPLDKGGTVNPKNGNLGFANTTGTYSTVRSTVGITSGKWYFEYTIVNSASIGGGSTSAGLVRYDSVLAGKYLGQDTNTLGGVASGTPSLLLYNGTNKALSSGLNSFSVGAVIQYAYDADAGKLWVGVNNSWDGGNDPSTGSTPTLSSGFAGSSGPWFFAANGLTSPDDVAVNFGQRPFSYTPPSGFKTLNTTNLPTPTIGATASTTANKYMDSTTYTGNASTNNIINSGSMQPDFVWIKNRSNIQDHSLTDAVRGTNYQLASNTTAAETFSGFYITSLNSNGFSLYAGAGSPPNTNGQTYVAWQWRASNTTAVTNTAGSITSTVSANTTAGFSVVTWGGNSTIGATVGHGLGVAPSLIIVKQRNGAESWPVYHVSTGATKYTDLNDTAATATSISRWNNTAPSSSVITLYNDSATNGSGSNYVAYCFAQVAGYSAFGTYTGNGSSDGPFIFTGFKPAFVMVRSTSSPRRWVMFDDARFPNNGPNMPTLNANLSEAESTNSENYGDFLSNGFKCRATNGNFNGSGETYIYMMFAESPFKYSLAR